MDTRLAELLIAAAESELGISVTTDSPTLLRNKLYATKKELGLPEKLSIIPSPTHPESTLWIVKKE